MEGRWRVYGKAVSSNLTPHDTDGIGRTNDVELFRALRSGLGQHALIAYLRALPPVAGKIPAPRPPQPDDPPADSFFFGDAAAR
jgi:hypothetical protein